MRSIVPSLADIGIVDASPEREFDSITAFASSLLQTPVALVSIVEPEKDRQFFKSTHGLPEPWRSRQQTPLDHSFCQYVRSTGKPLIVSDARNHPLVCDNGAVKNIGVTAYLGVPILGLNNEPIGALCAIDAHPREWSSQDLETLQRLADFVNGQIQLRGALYATEIQRRQLEVLASTDALTGLANRRQFSEHATAELCRSARSGQPVSLVLLDVDRFKTINDACGHDAGDAVLVEFANRLRQHVRQHIDVAARLGGEEMAVLLPSTTAEYAVVFAERLRTVIASKLFSLPDGGHITVTASFGVATSTGGSFEALLKEADLAVYEAKSKGRNRVQMACPKAA